MNRPKIVLSMLQRGILEKIAKQRTGSSRDKERALIVLGLSEGSSSAKLSEKLDLSPYKIDRCYHRWYSQSTLLSSTESKSVAEKNPRLLHKAILSTLSDAHRIGCPNKFSAEQYCRILGVALEAPALSGHELTHWSLNLLKREVEKRGIVASISRAHLGEFLKKRGT